MEALMDIATIVDSISWLASVVAGGFLAYGGWLCLIQHFTVDRTRPGIIETPAASHDRHAIHPS
jgi:hypothetical protein